MEYLSLQDIPHRHCDPAYSQRMASTHQSERSSASMAVAVSPSHTPSTAKHLPPPPFLYPDHEFDVVYSDDWTFNLYRARPRNASRYPSIHLQEQFTHDTQNHLRSTPPMQTGDQSFPGRLPSFSEVGSLLLITLPALLKLPSFFTPLARQRRHGHRLGDKTRVPGLLMLPQSSTMLPGPTLSTGATILLETSTPALLIMENSHSQTPDV